MLPVLLLRLLAVLTLILERPLRTLALALLVLERLDHPKKPPPVAGLLLGLLLGLGLELELAAELEVLLSHEGTKAETRCMMEDQGAMPLRRRRLSGGGARQRGEEKELEEIKLKVVDAGEGDWAESSVSASLARASAGEATGTRGQ